MKQKLWTFNRKGEELHRALLQEISYFQDILKALESESVTWEEVVCFVNGIQRDTLRLYRMAAA